MFLLHVKRGNDELAPSENLLSDFMERKKALERKLGKGSIKAHNKVFLDCDYERRFRNQVLRNSKALKTLKQIGKRSRKEDVYFICYEGQNKACHRRILLRISEEQFGVKVVVDGVEPK